MHEVILVGNPNVGKTTLYNTMTHANEKASNWHGVTVTVKSRSYNYNGEVFEVTDIPGLYGLSLGSTEEKIASDYLKAHKESLIVNICDANNLGRNLDLTKSLIAEGYNVIVAVNMCNEIDKKILSPLEGALGVPVVLLDARRTRSVNELKNKLYNYSLNLKTQNKKDLTKKPIQISKINETIKNISNFNPYRLSDKIDKVLLNKFFFFPFTFLVVFLMFFITFGTVGEWFSGIFNAFFNFFFQILRNFINSINMSFLLKNFLIEGVIDSVSSIFKFIPQIVLLMLLIGVLEDVGFMSRVAFMLDGALKKIGLTGKSLFSIMMGYGCTSTAVMTTRNLESSSLKKRTALLLPFSTCSAKLPVFLVISSLFFDKYKYLFVFGLYLLSILVSILSALLFKKFIKEKQEDFILEMPKYRWPYLKKIFKDSLSVLTEFLIKVGTIILLFSSGLWLLQNFSTSFEYLQGCNFDKSILYFISSKLSYLFKPIGLGSAGVVASLLLGLVAKELVVVGLSMINGTSGALLTQSLLSSSSICHFTMNSSIVFLIFILLYSPCISALGAIKNEFGRKTAIFVFLYQFFISYIVCFAVFQILNNHQIFIYAMFALSLVIFVCFMVKLYRKRKCCRGVCNECGRF